MTGPTGPSPIISQNYKVPVVGGVTTAINNLGTVSLAVLAAAQARSKITFHNPNVVTNINILVCQSKDASGNTLTASFAAPGGGFVIFPGGLLDVVGDAAQGAWLAIAQSSTNQGLTITTSQG